MSVPRVGRRRRSLFAMQRTRIRFGASPSLNFLDVNWVKGRCDTTVIWGVQDVIPLYLFSTLPSDSVSLGK